MKRLMVVVAVVLVVLVLSFLAVIRDPSRPVAQREALRGDQVLAASAVYFAREWPIDASVQRTVDAAEPLIADQPERVLKLLRARVSSYIDGRIVIDGREVTDLERYGWYENNHVTHVLFDDFIAAHAPEKWGGFKASETITHFRHNIAAAFPQYDIDFESLN